MNRNTLIGLAAAALIAIVIAIVLNRTSQPRSESGGEETTYLVPALRDHVNDVDKVVVTGAENKPVATLTRKADGWSIAEKGGYAADTGKLREFLLKLADTKLIEQKTANKDKYADARRRGRRRQGCQEHADRARRARCAGQTHRRQLQRARRHVRASSRRGAELARVRQHQRWTRRRRTGCARTSSIFPSLGLQQSRSRTRMARPSASPNRPRVIRTSSSRTCRKGRDAGSEFTVNGLASTLGGLRFDDVIASKDAPPVDKPLKAHFATFDGLIVDAVGVGEGWQGLCAVHRVR